MRQYTADNLVVHPGNAADPDVIVAVTPANAGWDTINFQARRLAAGRAWTHQTGGSELALVVLGGTVDITSSRGAWQGVGQRPHVFAGLPYALYLPPHTDFTVTARTECEFAVTWVASDVDHAPVLVTPADVPIEIRGGDHATRQINQIMPPGFPCERLVLVEVYTPGGNWSSYPPHKHDVHRVDAAGKVLEADLEEIYFYKLDKPEGYAYQRVYTDNRSIDAVMMAQNHDAVLVPEGYHPVVSAHGYTTYYLNFLAGSAQSLANSDDPAYAWVKAQWTGLDPRLPVVSLDMEKNV